MGIRSVLEANFDFEIIDEFLDHYAMMSEIMEGLMVDLGNPDRYHRSIEELFRIFHNIKSASGYLQIEPMMRLAAFTEDALEQLRTRDKVVNEETITWLISVADMFQQWQEDLKMDNDLTKSIFPFNFTRYGESVKQLVAYITAGYPDKNFTVDLALALGENGVDTLELGVPFSDPVADGPVIEAANHRALEAGFRFADLLDISAAVAPKIDTLWMGYFNPFYQYGMEALLDKAASIGVNGLIIPDVPYEEAKAYHSLFESRGLANITFVAPTDGEERIALITAQARKFIYLVAYAGITGSGKSEDLQPIIEMVKRHTQTPVYVGFGVNEKTAREKVQGADGVIVGSAIVNVLLDDTISATQKIAKCCEITRTIKSLINE